MASGAARPVIALLTDFGTRDHYAGAMKGVILDLCRDAAIVDLTHDIPAHDVIAGGLELAAAYRYFPPGTIFVAVVDPGVGSSRRGIAAEAGGFRFVAPDNGVLTPVFEEAPPKQVVELTEWRYARPSVSRTFEGRDRFAPAAAWLAKGIELTALGPSLTAWHRMDVPKAQAGSASIDGEVIRVDRFGNLVTNIDRRMFDHVTGGGAIEVRAGGVAIPRIVSTYADADGGHPFALFGSTEQLEIAVNGASAAERLGLGRGARVSIRRLA